MALTAYQRMTHSQTFADFERCWDNLEAKGKVDMKYGSEWRTAVALWIGMRLGVPEMTEEQIDDVRNGLWAAGGPMRLKVKKP